MDGAAALQYVLDNNIEGAIVECGVDTARFERMWIECLLRNKCERDIFMYDTFTGLTAPGDLDFNCQGADWNMTNEQVKNTWKSKVINETTNNWCYTPLEQVKKSLESMGYNNSRLHYIVGDVMKTLAEDTNLPDSIALLRLDTDWYESSKFELEKLFPRVSKGGVVIFDDYWFWNGQQKATDEYFTEKGIQVEFQRVNKQTASMIKK